MAVAPAFRKTVPMTNAAATDRLYFRQLLAGRGLRVTEQRLAILRELARLRVPTHVPEQL